MKKTFLEVGSDREEGYWMALTRQVLVAGLLKKEIEQYGILKVTEKGHEFLKNPVSFMMTSDHVCTKESSDAIVSASKSGVVDDEIIKAFKRP